MSAQLETRLRAAAAAVNDAERDRAVPPFRSLRRRRGRRGPVLAAVAVAASVVLVVGLLWQRESDPAVIADRRVDVVALFPGAGGSTWTYDVTRNGVPEAVLTVTGELAADGAEEVRLLATWRAPDPTDVGAPVAEIDTTLPVYEDGRLAVPLAVLLPYLAGAPCTDVVPFVIDPTVAETTGTAEMTCGGEPIRIAVVSSASALGHELGLDAGATGLPIPGRIELAVDGTVGLTAFDMDGSVVGTLADPSSNEEGAGG